MSKSLKIALERYLLPDKCLSDYSFKCFNRKGETVVITDVHYGDDTLCYTRGCNGKPTKINTLKIFIDQIGELVILKKIHKMYEMGKQPYNKYYTQLKYLKNKNKK